MSHHVSRFEVRSTGRGLFDVTYRVAEAVRASGLTVGLATAFVRHTSASVLIQENADPAVRRDLLRFLERLAPDGDPSFEHVDEGPDDMSAHVRTALTATHVAVPFSGAALLLGTWQAIYLVEHRRAAHTRELVVHVAGDRTLGSG